MAVTGPKLPGFTGAIGMAVDCADSLFRRKYRFIAPGLTVSMILCC